MKLIKCLVISICYLFINLHTSQNDFTCLKASREIVTVWLHGTRLTPTFINKKYFFRKEGMHKMLSYDRYYNCRTVADLISKQNPELYPIESYYYFGWSGKLCFNERKSAAKELYHELKKLYDAHKNILGEAPFIRIITHSHGGNVLLNLAKVIPKDSPIVIDEAILLACPVQDKTKHLIKAPCFKKIFALYSGNDMFQVIDPQGWYKKGKTKKLFSDRTFEHCEKLRQARIKLNGKDPMHIDFFLSKFMIHLPLICKSLDEAHELSPTAHIFLHKQLDIRDRQFPIRVHQSYL